MAEHSMVLIAKGCCALDTDILPKGRDDLAPSFLPETSCSAGSILSSFQGVGTEGRESTWKIMSPGNSATQCAKKHDSLVAKLPPVVPEGLLRTCGRSAPPGVEACNPPATESPGCASSAPSSASRGHGSSASGFVAGSVGGEYSIPSLALGNSESSGTRRLSSKPRMIFEGQEFLLLGIASQGSAFHPVKGPDGITSVPGPPVHAPGRGNSPLISTEGSDALALSMPKGNDPPASSKEPKCCESSTADLMLQSYNHQTQDAAAMVHSAPTSITVEPNQAALSGAEPLHLSCHVIQAADILVAMSTSRKEGAF